MAVRPIVIAGEPVLHRGAELITDFDSARFHALVEDLWDTLGAAGGVGLAAPQVGVGLRVFVYDLRVMDLDHHGCVVNPVLQLGKITQGPPDPHDETEGCLSFPGQHYPLRRADWVRLDGFTSAGERLTIEADGFHARCLQHETDHLNGRLFVDRLEASYSRRARKHAKREGFGRPGLSWLPGVDPDPFADDADDSPAG